MPIDALPPEPNRIEGHEAFVDSANALLAASNTAIAQANALEVNVNAKEVSAVAAAANALIHSQSALSHANAAAASANFIGNWSDQAGGAGMPCSVLHNDIYWQLLNGIADITASEPGVSSDWQEIYDYKVKDNAADASPGYLYEKVEPYLSRPNLFINPNFLVNQEGYVEGNTLPASTWPADMWFCHTSGNTLKKTSVGESITLDNSAGGSGERVQQWNDDIAAYPDGTTFTFSVDVTNISGGLLHIQGMGLAINTDSTGLLTGTFTKDTSGTDGWSDVPKANLIVDGGAVVTFKNLKLEVGNKKTPYQIPQITMEDFKCRRYYRLLKTGAGYMEDDVKAHIIVPLSTPMQPVNNTISIDYGLIATIDGVSNLSNGNGSLVEQNDASIIFAVSGNIMTTAGTPAHLFSGGFELDARPF